MDQEYIFIIDENGTIHKKFLKQTSGKINEKGLIDSTNPNMTDVNNANDELQYMLKILNISK